MRTVDIIIKKRDQQELSSQEIEFIINGYAMGEIPDYQMAAWAMAITINGMTPRETADLTMAMAHSGDILDLSEVVSIAVDKHSTGGVGDKTTLVVEPTVSACGLPVGKMSGRGLGFSGGTLDKMEAVPGFRVNLTTDEFLEQLRSVGLVLTGQTADLAPADGKLYALRDVTGTVPSIPLIASSIMSKKIAAGAQAIVLDVKVGHGAFMKTETDARELAEAMVSIAKQVGRKAIALLSDMNQPLGNAVGNTLEVREAIDALHGGGPEDLREHCLVVASHMLLLGEAANDLHNARRMAQLAIDEGRAWDRFLDLVRAQGGDIDYVIEPENLPKASIIEIVPSPQSGFLSEINAEIVGEMAVVLGAGRIKKGDPIDHAVGIVVHNKVGVWVNVGEPLFTIHSNSNENLSTVRQNLLDAHKWSEIPRDSLPLFYSVVN